jgi:predicted glycosyltransferase
MRILFQLGHPAHFHLFINVINSLKENHQIDILIKKKDVLEDLLKENEISFENILPHGRKDDKLSIAIGQLKQDFNVLKHALKNRPDLMIGTSVAISHVGKLLNIPSINVNEDDVDVVPLYAKMAYPWASTILAPSVCRLGKWKHKGVYYEGYHELAYLHPNNFKPNKKFASQYVDISKPYYIIRFAKLGAHHDSGISGINNLLANDIVQILKKKGNICITSERQLPKEIDQYRIKIKPSDMHHVMAFASFYIGDSQTMAAEAGVLGVPFIRFNDFVGRISYLDELEIKYGLGYGIKTSDTDKLFEILEKQLSNSYLLEEHRVKKEKMLSEKIDVSKMLIWFIENYPNSGKTMKENPAYQYRFK